MTKREINLKPEEMKAILKQAKKHNYRDYLILRTTTVGDFRKGEVLGSEPRRWDKQLCKWFPAEPNVKGLMIEDLRDDGIWVQGKGINREKDPAPPRLVPLPLDLITELRAFNGDKKTGKIFDGVPYQDHTATNHLRTYARLGGIADWELLHFHRLRHYTTTQVGRKYGVLAARDIARHKSIATTNRYLAELDPEEKRKIIQAQQDLINV